VARDENFVAHILSEPRITPPAGKEYSIPRVLGFAARHAFQRDCETNFEYLLPIDGQVRLVRLQTHNFRLFLHKQADKRQISVCRMSKW
jgi:hypothetical protein